MPVLSDECYVEFTWADRPRTILEHGAEGVLAVHSLSKRSNLAGLRAGFYAGDPDLVHYLSEVRKHAGSMVPGPVQAAATVALGDDAHVDAQRERYAERLGVLPGRAGRRRRATADPPAGSFYLWAAAPGGDAWALTAWLAKWGGVLVAPGDLYGAAGEGYVRVALVQPMDRLRLVADRLRQAPPGGHRGRLTDGVQRPGGARRLTGRRCVAHSPWPRRCARHRDRAVGLAHRMVLRVRHPDLPRVQGGHGRRRFVLHVRKVWQGVRGAISRLPGRLGSRVGVQEP